MIICMKYDRVFLLCKVMCRLKMVKYIDCTHEDIAIYRE